MRRNGKPFRGLIILAFVLLIWLALSRTVQADDTWNFSVQVSASVQASPPQITLTWPQDTDEQPDSYTVYRKLISDTQWGQGIELDGSETNFTDYAVTNGGAYEYQIVKVTPDYYGYGYIYAGINAPLTESRGTVVLIVDNTYASDLSNRLARLQQDLVGDGWTVIRHDVSPNDSVQSVKSLIVSDYYADPADVNTVFLFGHVPVAYSGDIAPDEHVPNHQGAWPADAYYGDMTGTWTDNSVYDTGADDPRNWNVPGDGKFDQSYLPAPVTLMVGRVDLANMPGITWDGSATFPDEETLLTNYLDKDHNFRMKAFDLPRRGLIGDYFGNYGGEAFAASGWRNFAPFFGAQNITTLTDEGTWLPTLSSQAYLWSYGCGSGDWDSAAGLGDDDQYYTAITPDIYNADIQSAFVMLFGSWFGDWDVQDDFMRGVLATPSYGLACMWSGSPQWFCHHMALGQTLGFSTRLTQNNGPGGLYQTELAPYAGLVHVALMGDPTLRMHVVAPPANLVATANGGNVRLNWDGANDNVVGYNVYRASSASGPFARVNGNLVVGSSFVDNAPQGGSQTYMVRAVKLENTASGTYFNASEGIFATVGVTVQMPVVTVAATTPNASRIGLTPGVFTFTRAGNASGALTVNFSIGGTAIAGTDYQLQPVSSPLAVNFAAGASTATLTIVPLASSTLVGARTVQLSLMPGSGYTTGAQNNAAINIAGNGISGVSIRMFNSTAVLVWPGAAGRTYHVEYANVLGAGWTDFGVQVQGNSFGAVLWQDSTGLAPQRFYQVFETQ